jgi:hypothetical protein
MGGEDGRKIEARATAMSPFGESQSKLTLEDLERFLELPAEGEQVPVAARTDLMPYLEAAAVLAAFDPFQLRPTIMGDSTPLEREILVDRLLPLCEPVVGAQQLGLFTLAFGERRAALRLLATRENMRLALDANPDRQTTLGQRMFERIVEEKLFDLTDLSRDELAATITVLDWVEDILDGLPERAALRRALAKADSLAPMERLAAHGFVDRRGELQQLEQYVLGAEHSVPLFLFGSGGVGKSTLLAHFILEHLKPLDMPFAYIDIDRPTVRPDRPLTLLLEALVQLQLQLDLPASITESFIKEVTFSIGREESARQLESFGHEYSWHFDLVRSMLPANQEVVLFLDTFEEAQFLGPDVVWNLLNFLFELKTSLKTIRIILSGRVLPLEFTSKAFPNTREEAESKLVFEEVPLEDIPLPERPINLGVLDEDAARELLHNSVLSAGFALEENQLNDVIGIVGRNPMCLKLAARLLCDEGVEKLREARDEVLVKLKAEKIQALLYGRILHHVHDDDVRKVAYPGLIVRRLKPEIIRDVLAEPCGLELKDEHSEQAIFWNLAKEAALVEYDPKDGSLRHRVDVRRAMLEDLTDHVEPEVAEQINRNAVTFYKKQSGAVARAEEIYHRLRLGQSTTTLNDRWLPEAANYLKGAGEELPAQQRLWLASKLGITLNEAVRQTANQEAWEGQAARTADRLLQSGAAEKALSVLRERDNRLPRSPLYSLEAEALRFLGDSDEAIRVARRGVEAMSKAGAIDMVLELLLKMVVIEETRGRLEEADRLLEESNAVAANSHSEVLRLRVRITRLRLQRQLRPDAHEERAQLRNAALAIMTEEMLHKLRSHPVLLREVAAELGKEDPRIAAAAIETLGIEVATDAQAQALGQAIVTLNTSQGTEIAADSALTRLVDEFRKAHLDPDVIRKWVTQELTTAGTQRLSRILGKTALTTEVLRDFRKYFRAGVDSTLRARKK